MRRNSTLGLTVVAYLFCTCGVRAQQVDPGGSGSVSSPSTPTGTAPSVSSQPSAGSIPHLVRFSGLVKDVTGNPATGTVGLTFSLYELPEGGTPLWTENQNLTLDTQGHYTALLGANSPSGLPLDLFTSSKALWLGVQPQLPGTAEQPRVLLVAVPYALKSSDADTLGGLPPSAFVMTPSGNAVAGVVVPPPITFPPPQPVLPPTSGPTASSITGSGMPNFAAMFTSSTTIGNSAIYNTPGGNVGIGTINPMATLDVNGTGNFSGTLTTATGIVLPAAGTATATQGFNSNSLDFIASSFNSGTSVAAPQLFRWTAEPTGNNSSIPSATLNLQFLSGSGTPMDTGLSIDSIGHITFVSGQTFPGLSGGGTVTSVGSGPGLTGGPITTSGTLSIATGGVTDAMLASGYSGVGGCVASAFVVGLARNSAPLCGTAVTNVATGPGLAGGPITTTGVLSIPAGGVTNAMLVNSSVTVAAGTGLAGGGAVTLGGATALSINPNINATSGIFSGPNSPVVSGTNTTFGSVGQLGTNVTGAATGVYGSSIDYGVYGTSNAPEATGVAGVANGGGGDGVSGTASGLDGNGVYAYSTKGMGGNGVYASGDTGVYAYSSGDEGYGVYAQSLKGAEGWGLYALGDMGVFSRNSNGSVGQLATNLSAGPTGVYGAGSTYGVYGSGDANGAVGVYGFTLSGTGGTGVFASGDMGVQAQSASDEGAGVNSSNSGMEGYGVLSSSTGLGGYGVYGSSEFGKQGIGVEGVGDIGVSGNSTAVQGFGVLGNNSGTGGYAVYGNSMGSGGFGVYGTGMTGTGSYGIYGIADYGVFGESAGGSVYAGVTGLSPTGAGGTGVIGTGDTGVSGSGTNVGVAGSGGTYGVFAQGNLGATGTKPAVVALADDRVVELYAMESPELWFEDFGSGQLRAGLSEIALDSTFALAANLEAGYHVFLTPRGDCEGLYVAQETSTGFQVRELRSGKSNIAFDYRIVGKRRGYEHLRLDQLEADAETVQAIRDQVSNRPTHRKLVLHKLAAAPTPAKAPLISPRVAILPVVRQVKAEVAPLPTKVPVPPKQPRFVSPQTTPPASTPRTVKPSAAPKPPQ